MAERLSIAIIEHFEDFPDPRQQAEEHGITTENTRYFITSLPVDVYLFAKAVRSHWGIENSLHWIMDVVFRDDDCRIRKKHGPANFVTMKHITQNMLKSLPGKSSMRVRRKRAGWDQEGSEALQGFASCAWAGFGPRPSFRPHRNPGVSAGERAISGLKAGVSDHKGIER